MPPIQYKGRVTQLIAPTAADVERYQKLAENAGAPISKYLLAVLRRGPSHDYQRRGPSSFPLAVSGWPEAGLITSIARS